MAEKNFTTIKTRFGDLKLVGSNTVIQVTVDESTSEPSASITSTTPLIVRIEQTSDKTHITSTNIRLIDVINTFINKDISNGIILNSDNKMEVNSLDVDKLQQTNWLILDSEDADGEFTATTEAK